MKKDFNEDNFMEIFESLSAPADLSFFQKEELEFLRLKFVKDKKLKQHQKKYYWRRNDYSHKKVLDTDFFKKELAKISKKQA